MFCTLPRTGWLGCVSASGTCTCKHTLQQTQCAQRARAQGKVERPNSGCPWLWQYAQGATL